MAAHRYWRVRFIHNGTNGVSSVAEIEFKTVVGGADQCSGGTAISSSGTATSAFDDNSTTRWDSTFNEVNASIGYDFGVGNDKDILEYTIRAPSTTNLPGTTWALEYSDNNSTWTASGDRRSQTWNTSDYRSYTVTTVTNDTKEFSPFDRGYSVPSWWTGSAASNPKVLSDGKAVDRVTLVPYWEATSSWFPVPVTGTLYGVVLENGVPVPYAKVYLYFRRTGERISTTLTNPDGSFSFIGLDPTTPADPDQGKYFIVALDPDGGVRYNALIYDRVVPV